MAISTQFAYWCFGSKKYYNIVFLEKKRQIFAENWRKLAKIGKNCDYNIDPSSEF
jgi:hypothetical protein